MGYLRKTSDRSDNRVTENCILSLRANPPRSVADERGNLTRSVILNECEGSNEIPRFTRDPPQAGIASVVEFIPHLCIGAGLPRNDKTRHAAIT